MVVSAFWSRSAWVGSGRSVGVSSRVRRDDQLPARVRGGGEVLVRLAGFVEPVPSADRIGQRAVEGSCCDGREGAGRDVGRAHYDGQGDVVACERGRLGGAGGCAEEAASGA